MYKALTAYIFIISLVGCSVSGRLGNTIVEEGGKENQIIIKSKSLINSSFFIQRADIEVVTKEDRKSFLASVKYNRPDTFLISVRSKTGIEAARIFLTKDTILINDRLNRVFYYGTNDGLMNRYGYSSKLIYLILGGFIEELKENKTIINCINDEAYHSTNVDGMKVGYFFDCKALMIKKIDIESGTGKKDLIINYSGKEEKKDFVFYKNIELSSINDYEVVKIEISRLEIPYEGRIEFIPGRNFEQVEIK